MPSLYLMVSDDDYELPLAVADSMTELAVLVNVTPENIRSCLSKRRNGINNRSRYVEVTIPDENNCE